MIMGKFNAALKKSALALTSTPVEELHSAFQAGAAFGVIEIVFDEFIKSLDSKGLIIASTLGPIITFALIYISNLTNAYSFQKTKTKVVSAEHDTKIIISELNRLNHADALVALSPEAEKELLKAIKHFVNNVEHPNRLLQLQVILSDISKRIMMMGAASFVYFYAAAVFNKDLDNKVLKDFTYVVTGFVVAFSVLCGLAHAYKDNHTIQKRRAEALTSLNDLYQAYNRLPEASKNTYSNEIKNAFTLMGQNRRPAQLEGASPVARASLAL